MLPKNFEYGVASTSPAELTRSDRSDRIAAVVLRGV
jgi:hypothetical protein